MVPNISTAIHIVLSVAHVAFVHVPLVLRRFVLTPLATYTTF
jgi:hypothetical protein